jgi:hypothetical protein
VGLRAWNSDSREPISTTFTLDWQKDGGGWTTLAATGELKWAGDNNMVVTDATPATGIFFCSTCGGVAEDGAAVDNSAACLLDISEDGDSEWWWGIDPAGASPFSRYTFRVNDDRGQFVNTVLACSMGITGTLTMSDAGMNYHTVRVDDGVDLTLTEVIDLVISDAGMNYHTLIANNGADLTITEEAGAIDLVMTDGGAFHLLRVDNGVDLTLVEVNILALSDAGMNYHVLYDDGPLPATQVYPADCYHLNVVTPSDLTLVEINILVLSDAGMNYHDLVANGGVDLEIVEKTVLTMSDAGMNYHPHVPDNVIIDPAWVYPNDCYHDVVANAGADLVLVHDHYLVPSDAGMNYHVLEANGGVDLALVHDHYLVISDAGMNYHVLEANGGVDLALAHDHYLIITDAGMNYHVLYDDGPLPATQVYPNDCYHDNVVTPTDLTIVETGESISLVMTGGGAYHVTYDDGPLPATQVYPASTYHSHILIPSDLTLVEVIDLTITPDPYHDLITKDEVWFVQQAVHELLSIPDNLTLVVTHILSVNACFHTIEDGAPLTLVQEFTLVLSDAGVNYHLHVVTPTDLNLAGLVELIMTDGGAYHDTASPEIGLSTTLAVASCVHDFRGPPIAEDFVADWTEVDNDGVITVGASQISASGMPMNAENVVYRDMGANYFDGDFTHQLEHNANGAFGPRNPDNESFIWALTQNYNAGSGLADYPGLGESMVALHWNFAGTPNKLEIRIYENGSYADSYMSVILSKTLDYFITIERDDDGGANGTGRYTVTIRTGSHAGTVIDTISADSSVGEQNDFRYVFALGLKPWPFSNYTNFTVSNLIIDQGLAIPQLTQDHYLVSPDLYHQIFTPAFGVAGDAIRTLVDLTTNRTLHLL